MRAPRAVWMAAVLVGYRPGIFAPASAGTIRRLATSGKAQSPPARRWECASKELNSRNGLDVGTSAELRRSAIKRAAWRLDVQQTKNDGMQRQSIPTNGRSRLGATGLVIKKLENRAYGAGGSPPGARRPRVLGSPNCLPSGNVTWRN